MRVWAPIAVAGSLVAGLVFADGMPREIPDPALTPGTVASTDIRDVCGTVGGTYSQRHRATTSEMKTEVRRRYGAAHCGEIDHRLPLALGGADAIENLWCQPGPDEARWHFKLKDELETYVWQAVCHRHAMSLADGQAIFLAPDWRVGFCRLIGGAVCPP